MPMRSFAFVAFAAAFLSAHPAAHAEYDNTVPPGYVEHLVELPPDDYFAQLNSGLKTPLYADLRSKFETGKSYLILHHRLPSSPLDLRSGDQFRKSVLAPGLINVPKFDNGHVMLGWHCETGGGLREGTAAITGEEKNQQAQMILGGWGLTGIFSTFTDGHLQTPLLVESSMRSHPGTTIETLAIEVDAAACGRVLDFVREFLSHPNKPYRRFSLNADPLKFEGGGCGNFAISAAGLSGILDGVYPFLWRQITVPVGEFGFGLSHLPADIIPFPVEHDPRVRRHAVTWLEFLFGSWSASHGPTVRFMDPEMLFLFEGGIFRMAREELRARDPAFAWRLGQSQFVKDRKLKVTNRYGEHSLEPIDARFDGQAANLEAALKRWYEQRRSEGYVARGFQFRGEPGILLSR